MEPVKLNNSLQLRLSDQELADLDGCCAAQRRRAGENVPRTLLIRQAIREFVEKMGFDPPPSNKQTDKAA